MKVYVDYAATTPVDKEVLKHMLPYFSKRFGNASSSHFYGAEAKIALEDSRNMVAEAIGADPTEIIFTSGGTESDNLAIRGVAEKNNVGHIITSAIEHKAVLNTCKSLKKKGFSVTYLPVDRWGSVDPKNVEEAIREDTILVSIMHANNEIGTIEPIEEIAEIAHKNNVLFHTDAVQTTGKIPLNMKKIKVDLLSMSAHKIYGPKGVGALYIRNGTEIEPLLRGGGHEGGLRSGTENVAGVVGLAHALRISTKNMKKESKRIKKLRDELIHGATEVGGRLNGHPKKRLYNNAHLTFPESDINLMTQLDKHGIAASSASACFSHSGDRSHVLEAIGMTPKEIDNSIRFTLGRQNNKKEVEYIIKTLHAIIK